MKVKKSELEQLIQEGIWDSLKYYVGKMGSLEKGGKLVGKKKYIQKSRKQFSDTLDKASNAQVKKLIDQMKEEFEEFPNQKNQYEFLDATNAIAAFYDSLDAAVEKYKAGEKKGAMAPEVANGLVEALREYVRIVLDNQLADVYKHFKEDQEYDEAILESIFTNWAKLEKKLADEEKGETKKEKQPEKALKTGEESGTIKSLKSNLLPGALSALGAGFTAAHFAITKLYLSREGQELVTDIYQQVREKRPPEETQEIVEKAFGKSMDLQGTSFLGIVKPPGGNPSDFAANIDYYASEANRAPEDIIKMLASQNPKSDFGGALSSEAAQMLYNFDKEGGRVAGAVANATSRPSKEFFNYVQNNGGSEKLLAALKEPGSMSGHPSAPKTLIGIAKGGLGFEGGTEVISNIIRKQVEDQFKKQVIKQAGSGVAAIAAPKAGAILAGSGIFSTLGIGLAAAGAAVKLLRMKGLKSSRAQVLNDLEKTLKDFEGGGVLEPVKPEEPVVDPVKKDKEIKKLEKDLVVPPPVPPEPNVTRLALARLDDDGVKIYVGTRTKEDQRKKEQDLMQAAEEEGVVGRNTNPTTDTLDSEFRKLKRIPDTIKAQYDDIIKRMKGRSKKTPQPHFVVDKSVVSDIRNRLSRLKGKAKKTEISNDAIERYVEGALKSYLRQDGKMNLRDTIKLIGDFIGGDVSTAEKAILQNALVSYGLVKRTESRPGLKDAARIARNKRTRERRAEKKQQAQEPQNLQEHKVILDRWKILSGI